jgi:hypothetical protein
MHSQALGSEAGKTRLWAYQGCHSVSKVSQKLAFLPVSQIANKVSVTE